MKLLILTIIILNPMYVKGQVDPLLNHKLYKVEYGDQTLPDSTEVQGNIGAVNLIVQHFGQTTSASSQFQADLPYMVDLNFDGIVKTSELTTTVNAFGNLIWDDSQCKSGNVFACWTSAHPNMTVVSILNLPLVPIKMVRTANPDANWWWYE